jgi:hypothetical protein
MSYPEIQLKNVVQGTATAIAHFFATGSQVDAQGMGDAVALAA